ncbi:ankyrin repeat domain-containing protein [Actinokineospora auranticolor]|uniref:Ankyrin repeat protein n=1 Tax=Actinokineospora auranticolor TaxID=155976 RepID=A0A2S6GTR9_9PSEU|nr:ankyrin repeat domain-containing protein [Actinokineospora auranticolor]PPK68589.1 ankyrin repeat protein [Actinokineospora auranticolor]
MTNGGWGGYGWHGWQDVSEIRRLLAAGANPDESTAWYLPPLHSAAEWGTAPVVAELAARVHDVDALAEGRTALWQAVAANRPDNARALVAAGADPRRDMMSGWSPARLSLAGPTPDLFAQGGSLTPSESATIAERQRLVAALDVEHIEGLGIACVADISAAEAIRRLDAEVVECDYEQVMGLWMDDPIGDDTINTMWVTEVPGGCVVAQPWGYGPQMPVVTGLLSVGTVCYGMYANPKSGNQGSIIRDGETVGWDLHPGGGPDVREDVLLSYLYWHHALAYCFAYTGLRPTDSRSITGPPDTWIRLPQRDYWARE